MPEILVFKLWFLSPDPPCCVFNGVLRRKHTMNEVSAINKTKTEQADMNGERVNKEKSSMDKILGFIKFTLVVLLLIVAITRAGDLVKHTDEDMPEFKNSAAVPQLDYNLDEELLEAMLSAEKTSEKYISDELDKWIAEMRKRTDIFLDDYFSFVNVKTREAKAVYHYISHKIYNPLPSASTVARRELENEISKQIIKKEIAQQKIENITNQSVTLFMDTFDKELIKIQNRHNIPTPDWNKYLSRLCNLASEYETRSIPISAKIFLSACGVLTVKAASPVITKIGQKVGQKLIVKAGSKAASSLGAKTIGELLPGAGMCIAAVVIIWDLYDYKKTADNGRKDLKVGFEEYFKEMKDELMGRTENSIMGSIVAWENSVREQISKNKQLASN